MMWKIVKVSGVQLLGLFISSEFEYVLQMDDQKRLIHGF